jgi:hypothetical protein
MEHDQKLEILKTYCPGVRPKHLKKFFNTDIGDRYILVWNWTMNKYISFKTFKFFVKNVKADSNLENVVLTLSPNKGFKGKQFIHVLNQEL